MRTRNTYYIFILLTTLFLSSCASLSRYPGVGRIRRYTVSNPQVPESFEGFRIAFASDFHLKSKYKYRHLQHTVRALLDEQPDVLLLGGDYQEGCQYVETLFSTIGEIKPPHGVYAVLGNNDYERCTDEIRRAMQDNGIRLLEHETDTITRGGQNIILAGVANGFDLKHYNIPPTIALNDDNYVVMITHTPDYTEDVDIIHTDLVLAGHTHGGQVTLFGWIVPETGSKYGRRFLSGLNYNNQGIPVITSNGLGTSRKNIRAGARSDIIIVTLIREASSSQKGNGK
ncbi:MAG: metallophosphoesterase [Bacteroidaceae bacterium]|nr:metallophosphoesterase [Bacteroidaceae bacterium]